MRAGSGGATVEMNNVAGGGRRTTFRYGRLATWLVSGVLTIVFASYVALPIGLSLYLPQLAVRYGLRLDLERVRVDPFGSRLLLSGARIGTGGGSSIEWSSVEARIDLAALLSGRVVLDGFRLSDAKLIAGAPEGARSDALPNMLAAPLEDLGVSEFVVDEVALVTLSETLGQPVSVDWLQVASLAEAFRPEGSAIRADASVGEGRVTLRGRLAMNATDWTLDAEVGANDVSLDGGPVPGVPDGTLRGRFDGSGPVRFVYSPVTGGFSVSVGGRWAAEGLEVVLGGTVVSEARADWDGAAFMAFSGEAVETFSADADLRLRALGVDVADAFRVEATELALRIDASRTDAARLSIEGSGPVVRFSGKGGVFEAAAAEGTNLVSRVTFTRAGDPRIDVGRVGFDALSAKLRDGRSIDVEWLRLDHAAAGSDAHPVSVATATAERVDWRGFPVSLSAGTAARLSFEGIEGRGDGELRFAHASAGTVDADGEGLDLWLRDVVLDATTLSPAGTAGVAGARISAARFTNEARTVTLEGLSLEGVEQDEDGAVSIASGRVRSIDHVAAGARRVARGSEFELSGAMMSEQGWGARHARLDRMHVETDDADYVLREPAFLDATGAGGRGSARVALLGALEVGSGGNLIVVEELAAASPAWDEEGMRSEAIEAVSLTFDTADRDRWEWKGWMLTGVETTAAGRAEASTASVEALTMNAAGGSTAGVQGLTLTGLTFDGESTMRASNAFVEQLRYRARPGGADGGSGVGVGGLHTGDLEWNGEALTATQGAAPEVSVTVGPVRASFDAVEFTNARLGADGVRRLESLTAASHRGKADGGTDVQGSIGFQGGTELQDRTGTVLEWSAGELTLGGYLVSAFGETTLDSAETRGVEVLGDATDARLRAERLALRGTRIDPTGAVVLADARVEGFALQGADGRTHTAARALQADRFAIGGSGLEIASLDVSGIDSTIEVDENGEWVFTGLPFGADDSRSSLRARIEEAGATAPDSTIRFIDRTTDPDFATRLDLERATLRGFDSEAIDVPALFSVEATAETFTALEIDGSNTRAASPLPARTAETFTALEIDGALIPTLTGIDLDLNALVSGLSLPDFSPYSRRHLGRDVVAGHADVALDLAVRSSDLEGVAHFALNGVELGEPAAPEGSPAPDPTSALPEETQGTITLEVPLRGRTDDPGFDFDGLVTRGLAQTARQRSGTLPKVP